MFNGCCGAAAPIASPGEKLSQNRLFATDFATEVECGRECWMRYKVSDLVNVEISASLCVFNILGYLPHSTSDLAALGHLLPGRRDSAFGGKQPDKLQFIFVGAIVGH
jgi:hypothetical protein